MDRGVRRAGSAAALVGAATGLLAAAMVTVVWPRFRFPVVAVAERVATVTPGGVATFFIELLQHLALPLTVLVTFLGLALVTSALGRWALPPLAARWGATAGAIAIASPVWVAGSLAYEPDAVSIGRGAFAAGLGACVLLGALATARSYRRLVPEPGSVRSGVGDAGSSRGAGADDGSRRAFIRAAGLGAGALALGWLELGRLLFPRPNPGRLALAASPSIRASVPPADPSFDSVPGLSPRITALGDFYVVDEEIVDPDVDPASWRLSVRGLVDHPLELTYEELLAMPLVEQPATLECISNPVGGDLISTATWTGVRLMDLLARAGVRAGAVEVVSEAIGGYSDSIPLTDALRPVTLVAVGMNGQTLPREHGFPARLLAPGYYGMKQPKWLSAIEVVDQPYQGYWERRGWTKAAVVKTWSRIDGLAEGDPAAWLVAGVAFAGDRGIDRVEVSADDGTTWRDAELEASVSGLTWRRWKMAFDPNGVDRILVRATDGDGVVQAATPMDPHPSGATGYDAVTL